MPKIKVYLDNCVYNRPFDDQTQIKISLESEAKKHIQLLITGKTIGLVYSYVNRLENDDNPYTTRKNSISAFFKNADYYISSDHADVVEEKACKIMRSGVKPRDSLHVACALEGKCEYFIITDKPLLKYSSTDIIICNPIQFLDYYEEEKDESIQ